MRRAVLALVLTGSWTACFVPPTEQCGEPGFPCALGGGRVGDAGLAGGRAGGTAGGTAGGRAGGTAGGAIAGGFAGGGIGGGRAGGVAGGRAGGAGGGRAGGTGGGGAFAGGFGGGGGAFAGGFGGGGGAFAGGFGGGGGAFAGGFGGGGGAFAGGLGGGGGAFAGGVAGESCANPIILTVPSTTTGSTGTAASNHEFNPQGGVGCRRTATGTPDLVYAFVVPPTRTVAVNVTPAGWDAVINLVGDPSACGAPGNPNRVCLAGADDPERVSYTNSSSVPVVAYLVVSGFTAQARGDFTVALSFVEGDRCEGPLSIDAGVLPAELLAPFTDDYRGAGTNCAARSGGPDRVYRLTVPAMSSLSVQSTPVGIDTSISFALAAPFCSSRQCSGTPGDTVGIGQIDRATWNNTQSVAQDVLVIIDAPAALTSGSFSLSTTLGPISLPGDTCSSAPVISATTTLSNESLAGFRDDFSTGPSCDFVGGAPDRVYAVDVPPQTTLRATVSPTVMGFNPRISGALSEAACSMGSCFGLLTVGPTSRTLDLENPGPFAARYYLIVDGAPAATGQSNYRLSTTLTPLIIDAGTPLDAGVALGESCLAPEPLLVGSPVTVPLGTSFNDTSGATPSCQFGQGPDRVYSLTIPAMQRLTVIASPQSMFDLSLSLAGDAMACLGGGCLAAVNLNGLGGTESLTFDNGTMSARSVLLVVDSLTLASGTVGLFASFSAVGGAGDTCLNSIPISGSQTRLGQTTAGFTKDYDLQGPGCVRPLGPEVVYAVTLNPMQTLTVVMTSPQDAAINIVAGPASACGMAMSCLASADTGASGSETASYTNVGPLTQTVYVMLARWGNASATLTYDVAFTLTPP